MLLITIGSIIIVYMVRRIRARWSSHPMEIDIDFFLMGGFVLVIGIIFVLGGLFGSFQYGEPQLTGEFPLTPVAEDVYVVREKNTYTFAYCEEPGIITKESVPVHQAEIHVGTANVTPTIKIFCAKGRPTWISFALDGAVEKTYVFNLPSE